MSAVTVERPDAERAGASARPSMTRLATVELRKVVDTRAGFWLQLTTALLTVAIVAIVALAGSEQDHTYARMLSAAVAPASVLLPIVGILLVTSEWTQRTALITFSLVPQRGRVVAAKLIAGVVLALVAFAIALVVAAIGTAAASSGVDGAWSISLGLVGQLLLYLTTSLIIGIGFGAVLLTSAPAIVAYFALPFVFAALGAISVFNELADWLDMTSSMAPMTDRLLSGREWAQVGTTLLLWMVLPVVAGWWRIKRSEVR